MPRAPRASRSLTSRSSALRRRLSLAETNTAAMVLPAGLTAGTSGAFHVEVKVVVAQPASSRTRHSQDGLDMRILPGRHCRHRGGGVELTPRARSCQPCRAQLLRSTVQVTGTSASSEERTLQYLVTASSTA